MSDNLKIYDAVRQVPPTALKTIQAGRLKGMSDINPMWRIRCLTEQFGPCGIGWKYEITEKRLEPGASGEVSAFVDINLYVKVDGEWSAAIPGTGGSSYVANESRGLHTSDECFKMALTDAISVACKALGMGADVYWDKDTTKYSPRPVAAPAPTQTVPTPNNKPINWGVFWKSCSALGYTEAQVHEVAGVDSVKGFSREQLSELMAKLKAEKTA